jgi:L-ascorbate metabolism protein UlaG (beta-lactamase superfamily)
MTSMTVRLIGGPTALIEIGGLRLLTDPTFDPPGDHPVGSRTLVKTRGPVVPLDEIGPIDAVLLSHDQHPDNLDDGGRTLLGRVPLVLSTTDAERRLGGRTTALPAWQDFSLARPGGRMLWVTGVPAQHGPDGTTDVTGEVTGFVLRADDLPTVYVSGDNASLDLVGTIADRVGTIDVALLFAGAARSPLLDANLTLDSDQAARAAQRLDAGVVIPVHTEGWQHFTQGPDTIADAFARRGEQERLVLLGPGESTTL